MPARPLWTLERLERVCRKALVERGRIKSKPLGNLSAQVVWTDGGTINADVDPFTVSHLAGVVHELMHPILQDEMAPFAEYTRDGREDLGELAFNAWEEALVRHITTSRRKRAWWRSRIAGKLKGRN